MKAMSNKRSQRSKRSTCKRCGQKSRLLCMNCGAFLVLPRYGLKPSGDINHFISTCAGTKFSSGQVSLMRESLAALTQARGPQARGNPLKRLALLKEMGWVREITCGCGIDVISLKEIRKLDNDGRTGGGGRGRGCPKQAVPIAPLPPPKPLEAVPPSSPSPIHVDVPALWGVTLESLLDIPSDVYSDSQLVDLGAALYSTLVREMAEQEEGGASSPSKSIRAD